MLNSEHTINCIPYIDKKTGKVYNLLIVEPREKGPQVSEIGLVTSEGANHKFEEGIVIATCPGSEIPTGSIVSYKKIDRTKKDNYEDLTIDGKKYHVIAENEVWDVDDVPFNRIFIKPIPAEIPNQGLVRPANSESAPEKGIVVSAPEKSFLKPGDKIDYRKNAMNIYFSAQVNGELCDVLYEQDVFMVNGDVSPHKIIVRINMPAQKIKRETTETGLVKSPLFIGMLHNLQYGDVIAIGSEAQKMYPQLQEGETAILHHSIETDKPRLLWTEYSKKGQPLYEYRIIHCFHPSHREIFGVIKERKVFTTIKEKYIVPFHKNVFLHWDFELLEKTRHFSELVNVDFSLSDCKNIDQLKSFVSTKTTEAVEYYKKKAGGYAADQGRFDPKTQFGIDQLNAIDRKKVELKRDAERMSRYVKKDHLLCCKVAYPQKGDINVVSPYKVLYPINIMGKKYLIADSDYIIAKHTKNMSTEHRIISPKGNRVLVRPIQEEKQSLLVIPDSIKEKPQKASIIAIGPDVKQVSPQETILHRRNAGTEMQVNGETLIMLREEDIICSIS